MPKIKKPKIIIDDKTERAKLGSKKLNRIAEWIIDKYSFVYFNGLIWAKKAKKWAPSDEAKLHNWIKEDFYDLVGKQIDSVIIEAKKIVPVENNLNLDDFKTKVYFTNGYWDIELQKFMEIENEDLPFSPNIIPYDFTVLTDKDFEGRYKKSALLLNRLATILSQGQKDHKTFWFEYLGSAFVSHVPFSRFIIAQGGGDNGKSSEMRFFKFALGIENTGRFGLRDLTNNTSYQRAIMNFYGKTWAYSPDIKRLKLDDISELKQLTGGDLVEGRNIYSAPVQFLNYATIIAYANELPKIKEMNRAVDRRLLLRDMSKEMKEWDAKTILDRKEYEEVMTSNEVREVATYLAMIAYSKAYKRGDFTKVKSSEKLLQAYKQNNNDVLVWVLDDAVVQQINEQKEFTFSELFIQFKTWFHANNANEDTKLSQSGFTRQFKAVLDSEYDIKLEQKQKHQAGHNVRVNSIKKSVSLIDN